MYHVYWFKQIVGFGGYEVMHVSKDYDQVDDLLHVVKALLQNDLKIEMLYIWGTTSWVIATLRDNRLDTLFTEAVPAQIPKPILMHHLLES